MAEEPAPAPEGADWRDVPEGAMLTDAQWLQRLLDSPREFQQFLVSNVRAAAEVGNHCDQYRHREVIDILRKYSIQKTHTIRRLEALLSQDRPRQEDPPPEE